ncbi:MAG: polyprenyl synthetase family protein [Gemmatimonadaceae bacterium]
MATTASDEAVPAGLVMAEGFDRELEQLKAFLRTWTAGSSNEVKPLLEWQFLGRSKYFRPVTLFACHTAMSELPVAAPAIRAAAAVEMVHNVSLIVDDILDRSRFRRGVLTLHCRFGLLPALMTSGYITADSFELVKNEPFNIERIAELFRRLAAAETLQWRLRRRPLGVEDWRIIAGEDTGSMFEACACLGTGDEKLRHFGHLLGMLYHGCDDVGDVKGAVALGGGGEEDLRDGILTLPTAIAIQDPETALLFRNPTTEGLQILLKKMEEALPAAERYLDSIAAEAEAEATRVARIPDGLIALVRNTRRLSA